MKRLLFICIFVINVLALKAADITAISTAFQKGDAASLQGIMAESVDMAIADNNRKCNAEEAVSSLSTFFKSNRTEEYRMVHHADKGESGFFVANMKSGGRQYRVNVTYKTENGKVMIQSIRIE